MSKEYNKALDDAIKIIKKNTETEENYYCNCYDKNINIDKMLKQLRDLKK